MARGKNSDVFILLCLNVLFGMKGRKVPVFSPTFGIRVVGFFYLCLVTF